MDLAKFYADTVTYPPLVMWGELSTPDRVAFVWSANQASADAFVRYIAPLMAREHNSKHRAIALVQAFGDEQKVYPDGKKYNVDMRGPGALLFCAPNRDAYGRLALEYLMSTADRQRMQPLRLGKVVDVFSSNAALNEAFKKVSVDLVQCAQSDVFYNRLASAVGFSKSFELRHGIKETPAFIVGEKTITMRDAAGLRQIEQMWLKP